MTTEETKHRGGFSTVPRWRLREICSKGGKAAYRLGRAHQWTPEEAREAGKIGGKISRKGSRGL